MVSGRAPVAPAPVPLHLSPAPGSFTWSYANGDQSSELKGTYGLDDRGLLVLSMDDSQMVSEVTLPTDGELKFVIVGSPEGDPGLSFKKG